MKSIVKRSFALCKAMADTDNLAQHNTAISGKTALVSEEMVP